MSSLRSLGWVANANCPCKRRANLKTRQRILDAALHLFARCGFEGTSVQEIAKRTNVDEATVLRHFGDKQLLYAQVVQLAGDRFLHSMQRYLEASPATLADTIQRWVRALDEVDDISLLIRAGSLAYWDYPSTAVLESLNRRLVNFWQRRLNLVNDLPEGPCLRHPELARLIVAVAPAFAMAWKVDGSKSATSAMTANFAAMLERMANSGAFTMNGAARDARSRATPSPLRREDGKPVSLKPREWQVLLEVDNGGTDKDVARVLGVTEYTVKFHLQRVYRKLSVRRRTEALKVARSLGLL